MTGIEATLCSPDAITFSSSSESYSSLVMPGSGYILGDEFFSSLSSICFKLSCFASFIFYYSRIFFASNWFFSVCLSYISGLFWLAMKVLKSTWELCIDEFTKLLSCLKLPLPPPLTGLKTFCLLKNETYSCFL